MGLNPEKGPSNPPYSNPSRAFSLCSLLALPFPRYTTCSSRRRHSRIYHSHPRDSHSNWLKSMSAKWRALQHRHRYTYNAAVFPSSYTESLALKLQTASSKFYDELKQLVSLNSIYAQVNHAKRVAASFSDLLSNAEDEASVSEAARFYLEVLFLENSLPLHRTLVSALAKVRHHHALIGACLHALCDEYGGGKRTRFCVSRVALSVLGMPKLGYLANVIEECAILVARDAVSSLDGVVSETEDLARPSPIVMNSARRLSHACTTCSNGSRRSSRTVTAPRTFWERP